MAKGKEAMQIVLDDKFWNNSLILVRITGPLIRLLRVCDADEKPSMGYVYEGMQRAIEEFWVMEEELAGELDYEELEAGLEELPVDDDIECSNSQQVQDVPQSASYNVLE
ncbi:hypothetical protein ACH5RR_022634 [Cinchona calisaya]|uniref:Uncharacterized protein n=1 Tax=Cinchona calisaya TaxID=153742 RepID=A0ABD2ZC95_9GENT